MVSGSVWVDVPKDPVVACAANEFVMTLLYGMVSDDLLVVIAVFVSAMWPNMLIAVGGKEAAFSRYLSVVIPISGRLVGVTEFSCVVNETGVVIVPSLFIDSVSELSDKVFGVN